MIVVKLVVHGVGKLMEERHLVIVQEQLHLQYKQIQKEDLVLLPIQVQEVMQL